MSKSIFIILIIIVMALSSSCDRFDLRLLGDQRIVTPCMFGPFHDTAFKCLTIHLQLTGCILEHLDFFYRTGKLSLQKVVKSLDAYVIDQTLEHAVSNLARECVEKANLDGAGRRNIGDEFVKCLNEKHAFSSLFPLVFCEKEETNESVASTEDSSAPAIEKIHGFDRSVVTDGPEINIFENCELGPFRDDSKECLSFHGCSFAHLGYFTEHNKLNISRVLDSIRPYIVNLRETTRVNEFMKQCGREANSIHGTTSEVGSEFMRCWITGNVKSIFHDAFCPKIIG